MDLCMTQMQLVEEWMAEKCPDQQKETILSKTYNDLSLKDVALKKEPSPNFPIYSIAPIQKK